MNVAIVDDERLARDELRRLLQSHPDVVIAVEAATIDEAVDRLTVTEVDLLLLDIQMPGGTGFDLLERLERVPRVIFTTAYDAFAVRAFEVNALDYLMKPVHPDRLAAALDRVRGALVASGDAGAEPPQRLEHVFVRDGERCWLIPVTAIALFESEGNYTRVHFGSERPLIRRSLNVLEEQLDPAMFFRAGRKEIVNLKWIDKVDITVAGGLCVTLRGGRTVEMSRRQSTRLREILSL